MPEDYFDEDDHTGIRFGIEHRERWRDIENIEAGTPAEKRRHHFVPQMWLRNWADPATNQVEVFDIANKNSFQTKPASILFVKDLYSTGTETSPGHDMGPEEAFSRIEGAGAAAMKAVLSGGSPNDEQRYDLALLIALQHLRVPDVIATAVPKDVDGVKEGLEEAAAILLANPDGPPPPHFAGHANGRTSHEIAQLLLDGFDEFDAIERGFSFWNLLDAIHHLAGAWSGASGQSSRPGQSSSSATTPRT